MHQSRLISPFPVELTWKKPRKKSFFIVVNVKKYDLCPEAPEGPAAMDHGHGPCQHGQPGPEHSWALEVFWNFFNNKK